MREVRNYVAALEHLRAPYLNAARATQVLNVSNPTARQAIALLQGEGLLAEMTGRSWRRIYLARPILEAIEDRS